MLFSRYAVYVLAASACLFAILAAAPAAEAAMTSGSCGPGRQPGWNGVCHSDGWYAYRRACPPGWHLGPYGRRCRPN